MRLSAEEAAELLAHGDLIALGRAADAERARRFGDTVTFIVDRNINYTNICVNEWIVSMGNSRFNRRSISS